jgi:hypothetical protein
LPPPKIFFPSRDSPYGTEAPKSNFDLREHKPPDRESKKLKSESTIIANLARKVTEKKRKGDMKKESSGTCLQAPPLVEKV